MASIRPHATRTPEARKVMAAYQKCFQDMSELPSIIHDVSRLMNIRGYSDSEDSRAFAPDALRIEVTGPIGLHLSVVDLPGLISVSNDEQTTEDINAVRDMVATYLGSSRTIILAVLQASNDIANQPIITLAREHDPQGQRTVGIITKPDLINRGTEGRIALIAKNQDNIKLNLGFFLIKNPSPSELEADPSADERSRCELRFFSDPLWTAHGLDPDRVGIENLRTFLQNLLDAHIDRELPKVREEIKAKLATTEVELKALGDARTTTGHIRTFLTSLSMNFFELLQAALEGNYLSTNADFFSQGGNSRLRAQIQVANTKFATTMREKSQKRRLAPQINESGFESASESDNEATTSSNDQLIVSKSGMLRWVHLRTRGKELPGNHNPALLAELFCEQSERWQGIAAAHVRDVLEIVAQWIHRATETVIQEERLRGEVSTILQDWLEQIQGLAMGELAKLLEDERRGPLTYNHYYTDNVQKSRLDAQRAAIRHAIDLVTTHDWNGKLHISNIHNDIEKFVSAINSRITVDMDEQACNEAVTELNAYYKVALKTFVDNVARQVIERHILGRLPQAFCPNSVAQLSDETLLRIGSESEQQTLKRDRLAVAARGLRSSLMDLQRTM
ncbi:hypothetical protein diail_7233 [Diaporthe ilicicola]|nr:hypothetical protein diail_7233 [Diaporthe ilicicola]